ncbi:OLC1v1026585C1 [Oldenlandia corymbosa var. corymbosa]|uniref:OLC1v1026585C1 n=1 Tax=Oldenlandia corymbosa var. corymbosa TaxID=529605 RepID=A0AAV1C7C8_OLDCO|nr:OLC1v1026585C1 [Oldenlandia corymbosa var. corymbosa]
MVRIQVKHACRSRSRSQHKNDGKNCELEFLYDCESCGTSIEDMTEEITEIANLQFQIHHLTTQFLPRLSLLLHTNPQVISLHRALSEATSYASKDQVMHGKPLLSVALRQHMRSIESEFAVNYQLLDFPDAKLERALLDVELLQEDSVQLLWAGKELMKGKTLADYIGKNEKTKIILRLLSRDSHSTCKPIITSLTARVPKFDGFLQF